MIRKYLTLLLAFALLAQSCSDDALDPVVKLGGAPAILSPAGGAAFVLEEANAANILSGFSWSAADFGFDAAVTYTLEVDKAGNDFAEAVTLGVTSGLSLDNITVEKLNAIMLAKELTDGVAADLEIRVVAKVSDDVETLVSPTVSFKATPYETVVVYPQLQVPGSYQGWDPSNNSTIIFSTKSDEKYEGYVYVPDVDSKHKFTKGLSWDVNWGDDGGDGTLEPNGADIVLVDAGMYRFNVDLNALTHTSTLTNWGLIGSATPTGWDSDTDMAYDAATGHLTITTDLVAGEIKFRANDAWDINLGDEGPNGKLEYNGANIVIAEPGNYTIDLILNVAKYTFTVTKN
jgi:starch-binding outer membrane protein SusE/F